MNFCIRRKIAIVLLLPCKQIGIIKIYYNSRKQYAERGKLWERKHMQREI